MTWPETIAEIFGGLFVLGMVLAFNTDFWENLVNRGKTTVEVIPTELLNDLTEVVVEMRSYARSGEHNSKKVIEWAKRISEAIEDEE